MRAKSAAISGWSSLKGSKLRHSIPKPRRFDDQREWVDPPAQKHSVSRNSHSIRMDRFSSFQAEDHHRTCCRAKELRRRVADSAGISEGGRGQQWCSAPLLSVFVADSHHRCSSGLVVHKQRCGAAGRAVSARPPGPQLMASVALAPLATALQWVRYGGARAATAAVIEPFVCGLPSTTAATILLTDANTKTEGLAIRLPILLVLLFPSIQFHRRHKHTLIILLFRLNY